MGFVTGSKISDGSVDSETVDVTIAVGGDLTPRTNQDRLGSSRLLADGIATLSEPLTTGSTDHTFAGYTSLVRRNSTSEPFGKGWQLSGVDALDTNETGGILWVRDDGTAGLYSPLAERRGASLDPRVSATVVYHFFCKNDSHGEIASMLAISRRRLGLA